MPKFACSCGHVIDLVPEPSYLEGSLIRTCDEGRFYEAATAQLEEFILACRHGNRDAWVHTPEGAELHRRGARGHSQRCRSDVLNDVVLRALVPVEMDVIQCDACRRLWIQTKEDHRYRCWVPDGHDTHILGFDEAKT